jgi:HK97 family phage portal protein
MPSLRGSTTASSVTVTPERSLQIASVYSCVRLLSEAVSGLPVDMFQRKAGSRVPVEDHPVLGLVSEEPNPDIDAGELWRTIIGWMLLRGNGYAFIERNGGGQPIGLWPIAPTSVEPKRLRDPKSNAPTIVYEVNLADDEWAPLPASKLVFAEDMLHYRAFGLGIEGLSPIGLARQNVGISFAAQQYMGGFYARDASPGGRLEVENELTDKQWERLEAQWKALHEGYSNAHGLAVLEGGAKWAQTTLSPQDAAFIETQKFTRDEIASIYGVPPHMIGATEKSTSWGTGIAEQGIGFVKYSLRPWLQRLERVTRRRLLAAPADRAYRLRWGPDGLMQGDLKARYDAYAVGKQWGWLSTNDIRKLEDEAPVDGGDAYLQPLNMVPAGQASAPNARARRRARRASRSSVHDAWTERLAALLVDVFEEQRADVTDLGRLDREAWDPRLADVLLGPMSEVTREVASKVADQLGAEFDLDTALPFLRSLAEQRARNLNTTTEEQLVDANVDDVFDQAVESRSATAARSYVDHTAQFATHEGGVQGGATRKRWTVTSSNPRASHARMSGQEVGIDERFSNGAMWPGDTAAGVDEVAGCTCEVQIIAEEGADS